jgi:LmbE family N-acetylglucosaminyl deacetylase
MKPRVLAIAAHPDDIEIFMAGTLLRLAAAGWELHYFNLSCGNGGSLEMDGETAARVRLEEAREGAARLGARFYPPVARDLEIVYSVELLRKVAAVVREVNPSVVLTHALQDYMEDHMETARLAVTAAFAKHVPNFASDPPVPGAPGDVAVYHAMPHGGCSPLREKVEPDFYIDISGVMERKRHALEAHQSQQSWLDASQGMSSYVQSMMETGKELGRHSGRFGAAEAWRRHLHLGLSRTEIDPLADFI